MFRSSDVLFLFGLLNTVRALYFPRATSPVQQACAMLQASYNSSVFSLSTVEYQSTVQNVWSETCITQPACAFQPLDTQQLADGLAIITASNSSFSVRSIGHMPVPGSNGIDDGVFISLSNFNQKVFNDDNSVISIGPGQTWAEVYGFVSPYGLGVAGGRFSPVGVGGLLLGGGINYFGSEVGWSFSTVQNYEVVLSNSSIVSANATSNPDLFWALRGGGNNFGIVTQFDMQTIDATNIYGGFSIFSEDQCAGFLDAVGSFAAPGGGSDDIKSAILPTISLNSATGDYTCTLVSFYHGNDDDPAALANFTDLNPETNGNSVSTSFVNYTDITNITAFSSQMSRWLFAATAMQVAPESTSILNQTFMETVQPQLTSLTDTDDSSINLSIQPITKTFLQAAVDSGGDAIDLDPENGNFYAVLIDSGWQSAADDEIMNNISRQFIVNLDAATQAAGLYYDFSYLNDAQAGQSIYPKYGAGKSLARLQEIQNQYDLEGIFAQYFSSGFPL